MEFWKKRAENEEEKATRVMIELRKKSAEHEAMSTKWKTNQSERQSLRERVRDLEDALRARQQQLDTLLKALEEKNDQYDRDTLAYKTDLQEREMQLGFLINKIRQEAMHVVQLSDEAEDLSCQFLPSQQSSISEFLERVKKYSDIARKFV
ncbi:uncharacterized protein LOC108475512 [Gossypium arboreum]|uniref:Uncharacterized protein n=1 Tax=Gossypium arboreum TaxID=29729 RepID=A0ABR0PC01_GOSAR|nr:uncharacterized protein LOC108475512 [Gossypium arboreum]KAK5818720.1 hypothetical protein PVK06_023664 [Gossypium arboreum]